jgi:hypothetical protein
MTLKLKYRLYRLTPGYEDWETFNDYVSKLEAIQVMEKEALNHGYDWKIEEVYVME